MPAGQEVSQQECLMMIIQGAALGLCAGGAAAFSNLMLKYRKGRKNMMTWRREKQHPVKFMMWVIAVGRGTSYMAAAFAVILGLGSALRCEDRKESAKRKWN
jgi:hypothetical protein